MPDIYVSENKKKKTKDESIYADDKKHYEDSMENSRQWWKVVIDEVLEKSGQKPGSQSMGAFVVRPKCKFITQQEDEEIVLLLRAHPVTNIPWLLLAFGMLLLPSLFSSLGVFTTVPVRFVFIGQLIWYLMTLVFAFEKFLYWYYSVFIVTNERLVDIDFENLLWRVVTIANLNHIEEPAMVTGGFIRSLLQYGDVYVTTASEEPSVEALAVPWPQKVIDVISRLSEELEKRREQGE